MKGIMNLEKHTRSKIRWKIFIPCIALIIYLLYVCYTTTECKLLVYVGIVVVGTILASFGEIS